MQTYRHVELVTYHSLLDIKDILKEDSRALKAQKHLFNFLQCFLTFKLAKTYSNFLTLGTGWPVDLYWKTFGYIDM